MRFFRAAVLLAALTLVSPPLLAQPATGAIGGLVSSADGVGLPGATVTVRAVDSGQSQTVVTGDSGEYAIEGLAPGTYDLQAELLGFASVMQTGVTVTSGGRARVAFLLLPGVVEALSVTGRSEVSPQPRSTIQQTISDRLTHSLPLFGRDFISLVSLAAGVTGNPNAPSVNGQIYWSTNLVVDGASHFSKWRNAPRTFYSGYPLEAIRDVQVLTSQFTPEFGDALSAVATAVTRSGSNTVRGSALVFLQSGVLNDTPVFAAEKPSASSIRDGVTFGGPVQRDRTFFFGSYEGRRSRSNNIVVSPVAPQVAVPNDEDEHLAFVKLDHRYSAHNLVNARYNGQWFTWVNEAGGLWLPGSGTRYRNDVHTVLVTGSQLVSARLLNQTRVQFARYSDLRTDLAPTLLVSRAGYSIEGSTLGPYGFGATPEDTWEAADLLTLTDTAHVIKFGGGARYVRAHNEALPYGRGAYYFAGPPSLYPEPFAFVQNIAVSETSPIVDPRSLSSFAFVQDDWRIGTRVTANLGLRYDIEQITHVTGYDAPVDANNLQPRAAATWSPFGRLVVRGGAGVFTQQHLLYYINRAQLEGPAGSAMLTLTPSSEQMPAYPEVLSASVLATVPRDVFVVSGAFRNPYSVQAAVGAQHPLFGFEVAADYIYLAGHDLMSIIDANAPASVSKPASRTVAEADVTRPLAPTPGGYRKVITLGNEGRSWYHALQVKAERSADEMQALFTYTLARARDRANYQLPEDSRNMAAEEARASTDVRHSVTAGLTWRLPFNRTGLGGWVVSATGLLRTNRPYTITWGDDRNGTTQNDARPDGRNTGRTGPYRTIDIGLARRLPVDGRVLELRAEAFNVLSTINYDEYIGALNSPQFGQPVSAFPRRRLQFAAIFRF